jgi:hypothetical protein
MCFYIFKSQDYNLLNKEQHLDFSYNKVCVYADISVEIT